MTIDLIFNFNFSLTFVDFLFVIWAFLGLSLLFLLNVIDYFSLFIIWEWVRAS